MAAAPEVVTNRGDLEFKIMAPSTQDHDYVVLKVPDLARFQTVVEACAKEVRETRQLAARQPTAAKKTGTSVPTRPAIFIRSRPGLASSTRPTPSPIELIAISLLHTAATTNCRRLPSR